MKLSDELASEARREAALSERSIAGQIEHWAKIGRLAEQVLPYSEIRLAKQSGALSEQAKLVLTNALAQLIKGQSQNELHAAIHSPGRILYAADPQNLDGIVQVLPTGERIPGRMLNRQFVANS